MDDFKFNIPSKLQKYHKSLPTIVINGRRVINVNLLWKLNWGKIKNSSPELYKFYTLVSKQLFFNPTLPNVVKNLSENNKEQLLKTRRILLKSLNNRDKKYKRKMIEAFNNLSSMDPMLELIYEYRSLIKK